MHSLPVTEKLNLGLGLLIPLQGKPGFGKLAYSLIGLKTLVLSYLAGCTEIRQAITTLCKSLKAIML
jgi:hypothetical protein